MLPLCPEHEKKISGIYLMKNLFLTLVCFLCLTVYAHAFMGMFHSATEVQAQDGMVEINTTNLKNEQAQHYFLKDGKNTIRFFVVRDKQGTVRTAIDACEVCWKADKGYRLEGSTMLCVNCGQKFALQNIGVIKGGCNPHPIPYETTEHSVRIPREALTQNAHYFPKNIS